MAEQGIHVAPAAAADPIPGRGLGVATFVIALARFIVVLDGTIMTWPYRASSSPCTSPYRT